MADPSDVDVPEMLPGETRAEWIERVRGQITENEPPTAEPFDPDNWADVRKPFRE